MVVYLASSQPLPLIPWDVNNRGFHVTDLSETDAAVRTQFTLPHVYYVGSSTGCGCEFQYGEYECPDPTADELAELADKRRDRAALADYLRTALARVPRVELYACWSGDEHLPRIHAGHVAPGNLITDRTYFHEREFLEVTAS